MISTPARYRYTRTGDGAYRVGRFTDTDSAHVGSVRKVDGAWIATTPDGHELGDRYATRVQATDALSVTARRRAELDALPTDDDVVDAIAERHGLEVPTVDEARAAVVADELVVQPGDTRPSCPSCRYYSGHTSWCPRRHAEQPAEQLTVDVTPLPRIGGTVAADYSVGGLCDTCTDDAHTVCPQVAHCECCEHTADSEPVADPDALPAIDRTTAPTSLTDQALWLQFMLEERALAGYDDVDDEPNDERHGALIAEVTRRFGADAMELTADYSVASRMSSDDLVTWAAEQFPHLLAIATGRLTPEWRRDDEVHVLVEHGGCGRCDRLVERAAADAIAHPLSAGVAVDGEHRASACRDMASLRAARTLQVL